MVAVTTLLSAKATFKYYSQNGNGISKQTTNLYVLVWEIMHNFKEILIVKHLLK